LSSVQLAGAIRWFIVVSFMTLSAYGKASSCGGFTVLAHWWVNLISALADVLFACYYDFICELAIQSGWIYLHVA